MKTKVTTSGRLLLTITKVLFFFYNMNERDKKIIISKENKTLPFKNSYVWINKNLYDILATNSFMQLGLFKHLDQKELLLQE